LILEELHALEGSSTTDQFVGELGLMLIVTIVTTVDLLVGISVVVCVRCQYAVAWLKGA